MQATTVARVHAIPSCCPLCNFGGFESSFAERGYQLRRCMRCDLFYIWPYPSPSELQARVEHFDYENFSVIDPEGAYNAQSLFYQGLFPKFQSYCEQAQSVLDVGSGAGNLLKLINEVNPCAELFGVELNVQRAAFSRDLTQASICELSILELPENRTYDVITLINVFSHVPAAALFNKLSALMHENSRLILRVTEMQANVAKTDLHDWEIPDHIQFPGMRTIEHVAQNWRMEIEFHERVPIADVIFTRKRFAAVGKSRARNLLKRLALNIPFFLPLAKQAYKMMKGERLYSTVAVLRRN
ncbi:MAG: class I SAM-dependent methyltransferase [Chloroflexales bacterium]|nr:class I SAM-dependent methyltransferase [Chloroflexales bacterium]